MKYCKRIFFSGVVVGAVSGAILACSSTPRVGETHGGASGSVSNAGGGSSGTASGGAAGEGSTPVGPVIVLPDASATAEVAPDLASAPASGDANCGATQSRLEKKPADLLLLLDRSTSMTQAMDSSQNCAATSATCAQRWATIIASLNKVLTASPGDLNWGLKFFSSPATGGGNSPTAGSSCYVSDGVDVPVGSGNASKIQTQISAAGNATSTPTRAAVEASIAYLKTVSDGNDKYILLATDGEPNCAAGSTGGGMGGTGTSDLSATVTAVQNAVAAGYKVFVIGVGPDAASLTSLAQAGATDKFYSALTPEDLSSALATIVGTVAAGCTYQLPSEPVIPNAVGVFVDKALIPQSDSDGWSYAPGSSTTINIHGSWCEDLKNGNKTQVEIFLPCKPTDIIPTVIP